MGCPHHRQVLRIINWRIIDGPPYRHWALRVVDGRPHLHVASFLHLHIVGFGGCFIIEVLCTSVLGCQVIVWNPYHRVAPNSSSRGCVTGRWASHVVVGFPSLALRTIRRRWVVYLGVGVLHCRSALPLVVMGSWSVRVFFFTWFATSGMG